MWNLVSTFISPSMPVILNEDEELEEFKAYLLKVPEVNRTNVEREFNLLRKGNHRCSMWRKNSDRRLCTLCNESKDFILRLPLCLHPEATTHNPESVKSILCSECFYHVKIKCGNIKGFITFCNHEYCFPPREVDQVSRPKCQGFCNNESRPLYNGICKECRFGGLYMLRYTCNGFNHPDQGQQEIIYFPLFISQTDLSLQSQFTWYCQQCSLRKGTDVYSNWILDSSLLKAIPDDMWPNHWSMNRKDWADSVSNPDPFQAKYESINEVKTAIAEITKLISKDYMYFNLEELDSKEFKKAASTLQYFRQTAFSSYNASNFNRDPEEKSVRRTMAKLLWRMAPSIQNGNQIPLKYDFTPVTVAGLHRAYVVHYKDFDMKSSVNIAFIGSDAWSSWLTDFYIPTSILHDDRINDLRNGEKDLMRVHRGIENMFLKAWGQKGGIYDIILGHAGGNASEIANMTFYISGHSLGGALAQLCVLRLRSLCTNVVAVTFGSPYIFYGSDAAMKRMQNEASSLTVLNIQNTRDYVSFTSALVGFKILGSTILFTRTDKYNTGGHTGGVYDALRVEQLSKGNVLFYKEPTLWMRLVIIVMYYWLFVFPKPKPSTV